MALPDPPVPLIFFPRLSPMHVPGEPTNECLVGFHVSTQPLKGAGLSGQSEPMQHEPRCFLRDLQVSCDFAGRNAEKITPGYNSPTINRLEQSGWCSVRAMVKRSEVISIMEQLEQLGATAILETAISNCRL